MPPKRRGNKRGAKAAAKEASKEKIDSTTFQVGSKNARALQQFLAQVAPGAPTSVVGDVFNIPAEHMPYVTQRVWLARQIKKARVLPWNLIVSILVSGLSEAGAADDCRFVDRPPAANIESSKFHKQALPLISKLLGASVYFRHIDADWVVIGVDQSDRDSVIAAAGLLGGSDDPVVCFMREPEVGLGPWLNSVCRAGGALRRQQEAAALVSASASAGSSPEDEREAFLARFEKQFGAGAVSAVREVWAGDQEKPADSKRILVYVGGDAPQRIGVYCVADELLPLFRRWALEHGALQKEVCFEASRLDVFFLLRNSSAVLKLLEQRVECPGEMAAHGFVADMAAVAVRGAAKPAFAIGIDKTRLEVVCDGNWLVSPPLREEQMDIIKFGLSGAVSAGSPLTGLAVVRVSDGWVHCAARKEPGLLALLAGLEGDPLFGAFGDAFRDWLSGARDELSRLAAESSVMGERDRLVDQLRKESEDLAKRFGEVEADRDALSGQAGSALARAVAAESEVERLKDGLSVFKAESEALTGELEAEKASLGDEVAGLRDALGAADQQLAAMCAFADQAKSESVALAADLAKARRACIDTERRLAEVVGEAAQAGADAGRECASLEQILTEVRRELVDAKKALTDSGESMLMQWPYQQGSRKRIAL